MRVIPRFLLPLALAALPVLVAAQGGDETIGPAGPIGEPSSRLVLVDTGMGTAPPVFGVRLEHVGMSSTGGGLRLSTLADSAFAATLGMPVRVAEAPMQSPARPAP